jgi:L-threonylcarbamoyladenylate synthase
LKTQVLPTRTPDEQAAAVARAVTTLQAGETVALPTETVYGLAADALNADAVAKIFEAKERPKFDPLIVHLPDAGWLEKITNVAVQTEALVATLTERFWPGPLTLVLPRRDVPDIVTAGLETVAVRMSAHPILARILTSCGRPVAAPSANRFGRISPTAAEHVVAELDGRIPLIIDGGSTQHGVESTIVAVEGSNMRLLRRGPITAEQLGDFGQVAESRSTSIEAPGQLASHYAPATPLKIVSDADAYAVAGRRCGLLAWKTRVAPAGFVEVRHLSATQDMRQAAANLFRTMRELDAAGLDLIIAEAVPEQGVGAAIMDRLRRAAARR